MYALTFVLTVVTLQRDHIKFQLNQLMWTVCVLLLTLGQLKWIMHNVFNGLFWFTFPALLVVINDIMAYVCGMTFGRKIIKREFMALSPNKTWEGFIGGGIFTIIFGYFLAGVMAENSWMTCPVDYPDFFPGSLDCSEADQTIFREAHNQFPSQVLEFFPASIVRQISGVVEYCKDNQGNSSLCPEASAFFGMFNRLPLGEKHDRFMLSFDGKPIQLHAISLAIFASLVAPFGGFFASGIKRAYGIKDFDSLIPGHGGIMDRMDCQLLMALCAWVHYNAFVDWETVSVEKLVRMYKAMPEEHHEKFYQQILALRGGA